MVSEVVFDEEPAEDDGFSLVEPEEVSEELSPEDADDDDDEEDDDEEEEDDEELEDEFLSPSGSSVCLPLQYLSLISGT